MGKSKDVKKSKAASDEIADQKKEETALIAAIAAKEALKESIEYLNGTAFRKLIEQNNEMIQRSVNQAFRDMESEKKQKEKLKKKTIIKNTELLIVNFRKCKEMVAGMDLDRYCDEGTFLASEELTLETLEKYRMKTYKMVRHIENMLAAYEHETNNGPVENQRCYAILRKRYIDEHRLSVTQIMEYFNVGQSTVYSDTKKAIKDMASFIFGYEAVMFM